jgi:hypothetical protein
VSRAGYRDRNSGQTTERLFGVSYSTAFKIVGPTPRVERREHKIGRAIKWPDEMVLRARQLGPSMRACDIAVQLAREFPAPTPAADWVQRVLDGIIRNNVKGA